MSTTTTKPTHSAEPAHGAAPTHSAEPAHGAAPTHNAEPTHGAAPTHSAEPTHGAAPTKTAEPVQTAKPIVRPAPPKLPVEKAIKATFSLDSFKITETRSRHEDTDYVSFTLLHQPHTGKSTTQTLKKSMGDKNNGTFSIDLSFPAVEVKSGDQIVMNYLIVNSGHQSESKIYSTLETAGSKLATTGLAAAGAAIGTAIPIPGLGTALGALAGWLTGEVSGLISADCDGPVAAEQVKFTYEDLAAKTAHGPFKQETKHPGTDSAHGCGHKNSMYYVNWHIQRD